MIKPVLLLVDDDRAVLEALEQRLDPVFGNVCRIESFDDPHDVLDQLDDWNEEGRTIAVAVVDQRMPGTTGVELLEHIRTSDCGARVEAALLTGYADLDAAIGSKNRVGIRRYLQKPEDVPWIVEAVRGLLRARFANDDAAEYFTLDEFTEREALLDAFRLRQEVYREDPEMKAWVDPAAEFDIDGFDGRSIHIGLVRRRPGHDGSLVGTSRIVTTEQRVAASSIGDLVPADPGFLLPVLEYWSDSPALLSAVEQWQQEGRSLTEGSRLTTRASSRSRVAVTFLSEGTIRRWRTDGYDSSFLAVREGHVRFWHRYGFERVDGVEPSPVKSALFSCIVLHRESVTAMLRDVAALDVRRASNLRPVCRCASWSTCRNGAYATSDFRDVDVMCPVEVDQACSGGGVDR